MRIRIRIRCMRRRSLPAAACRCARRLPLLAERLVPRPRREAASQRPHCSAEQLCASAALSPAAGPTPQWLQALLPSCNPLGNPKTAWKRGLVTLESVGIRIRQAACEARTQPKCGNASSASAAAACGCNRTRRLEPQRRQTGFAALVMQPAPPLLQALPACTERCCTCARVCMHA